MITDDKLKAARQSAPAWTQDPATPPQKNYIKGLIESRDVPADWLLRIKELEEADGGLKKGDAGKIINALKQRPVKLGQDDRSKNSPTLKDVPVGRYAVQAGNDDNDISFYRVKDVHGGSGRKGGYRLLLQIAGPNETPMRHLQVQAVVKSIIRAGIGNSAALYGHKIKRCSKCHTRITNRVSRELGIGPVCGGRFYDDWEERVNSARTALRARGLDPDENVND
jgi:hypothetical protein